MTCHDVIMASQTRHFEFEAAILDPKPAVIQLTMTISKNYMNLFLETYLIKVSTKKQRITFFLQTKGKKTEKTTEKRQKIVKIHS